MNAFKCSFITFLITYAQNIIFCSPFLEPPQNPIDPYSFLPYTIQNEIQYHILFGIPDKTEESEETEPVFTYDHLLGSERNEDEEVSSEQGDLSYDIYVVPKKKKKIIKPEEDDGEGVLYARPVELDLERLPQVKRVQFRKGWLRNPGHVRLEKKRVKTTVRKKNGSGRTYRLNR